ncbi:MAG: DUF120 domain-containing protein, partial [Candidatus Helarchaeota archaeon]
MMNKIDCKYWTVLLELAKKGAYDEKIKITTQELGKMLNISQQSSSQRLIKLEKLGWITREQSGKTQLIQITKKGKKFLRSLYNDFKMIVESEDYKFLAYPEKIKGTVFTGLGEGAYYISLEGYEKQFIEKLKFKPYPGTLNLKLNSLSELRKRRILEHQNFPKIRIDGFENGKRSYGPVDALKVLINGKIEGAILFIHRTHHT